VNAVYPSTAAHLARDLPEWVPRETKGNEENTGFVPVTSSWIAGLKYTPDRGSEMVVKKGGKSYSYPGFNLSMFRRWVKSQSKGKWWWRHIGYPMKMSQWTGQGIHPLFNAHVDGPVVMNPFSEMQAPQVLDWFKNRWGTHVTPEHVAALTGWVPGTVMSAFRGHHDDSRSLYTSIAGRGPNSLSQYSVGREFSLHPDGTKYLHNSTMHIGNDLNNPFRGLSAPVYLRQLRAAYEVGVHKISMHAAQDIDDHWSGVGLNGGRHWAAIGADGVLPPYYAAALPQHIKQDVDTKSGGRFKDTHSVQHLFASSLGREHFLAHPVAFNATLDTTPGSYSRLAIERHVAENAARLGQLAPTPDAALPKQPLDMAQKVPDLRRPLHMAQLRQRRYHPMTEYLYDTGSLHPDYFDHYFET
jgi:hypothetical protein